MAFEVKLLHWTDFEFEIQMKGPMGTDIDNDVK